MTNLKKLAKRTIAVVIALTLLFSMCITAAVPATAASETVIESALIPATVADDYVVGRSYKKLTDLAGGGVNIAFTRYGAYEPYHYGVNMGAFDGIKLHFSNYVNNNTDATVYGNGKLLLMLANASAGSSARGANCIKFKPEVVGILIDTVSGALQLVEQDNEDFTSYTVIKTIATSSALTYANFTGKEFTVSFNKSGTDVAVTLVVGGTTVSGTMTATELANFKYCPTDVATYVSVGSVDSNSEIYNNWSVNFLGYKKTYTLAANSQVAGGTVANLISVIDSIPDTVTLADANTILTAQALYNAFGASSKAQVTNAAKLESAFSTLTALREQNLYAPTPTYYSAAPAYENQFPQNSYRTLFTTKTTDGFKVDFNRAENYYYDTQQARSTTLSGKYALDGLYISMKNFSYTKQSDFYLAFTSGNIGAAWDGTAASAKEQLVLYMGQDTNTLMLAGCGMTAPISLGDNTIVTRSNIVGKDVSFEWHAAANGDYYIYITVGAQVAGYRVSKAQLAAATGLDVNNVRITLSAPSTGNDFEVELDGIYAETSSSVKNVMNAIDALTASSSESAVNSAYAAYLALSASDKTHVINYPELNALRQSFRTVDENGYDEDGYYVPTTDDIFDISPTSIALAATNAANGGVKIDSTGAVWGMRTRLKDRYVVEDITLRFDNYNPNNGSFILGLASGVQNTSTWNKEAATGRFGIFFLIGYDNSVWVTVPYQANTMARLITDEKLSVDNLMNKEFVVNVKTQPYNYTYTSSAGPVTVERYKITFAITIDGKTITANVDDKVTTTPVGGNHSATMDQFRPDNAQVLIQSVGDYNPATGEGSYGIRHNASIDLTGIIFNELTSAQQTAANAVISAINALPDTATTGIQDDVDAVWKQYYSLVEPKVRAAVTNFDKLQALHDALLNLRRGDSIVTEYIAKDVATSKIDNSALVTPYKPDSEVSYDSTGYWPDYTKDLVMAEVNLKLASDGGTILAKDIEPMLQHLAETGVNGLWVMPIHDQGVDNTSIYCNYGPHTICPYLTGVLPYGTDYSEFDGDYTKAFANFKKFVDLAHSYNIRIFIDIVPWGVSHYAPIVTEHPEFFYGESSWGGKAYDENNKNGKFAQLEAWYKESIVNTYMATGVDGIRWDLEPNHFGYDTVESVRATLTANGKKPLFFSEDINNRGTGAYAFEQCYGITGKGVGSQTVSEVFFRDIDIVEAIKTGAHIGVSTTRPAWATNGAAKYYAYQMSSHDVVGYHQSSLASWAYEYAFSSFIPIFYMGEQWQSAHTGGLAGYKINWAELNNADNAAYFESVKQLIGLRWLYKDIVNSTVDNHKNTNICSVDVIGTDLVKGYARYAGNQAVVVVPNVNERSTAAATFTVELPMANMGLNGHTYYTVTDMLTGDMIVSGSAAQVSYFSDVIEHNTAGVYLVSANETDVTWSIDEEGTLTINGEGAITDAPWASAFATAKVIEIQEGITSVPADAFANFTAAKRAELPATLESMPALSKDVIIVAAKGSAIEALAKAAGYTVINDTTIIMNSVVVTKNSGISKVEVYVSADIYNMYDGLKVVWGNNNAVTKKTTRGNTIIFNFTTTSSNFNVWLTDGSATSEVVAIDMSKMAVGGKYFYDGKTAYGDANEDGVLNIKDLVRAKKMVADIEAKNTKADVNGDYDVTVADLALTAKLIIKAKNMECHIVTFLNASGTVHEVAAVPSGCKAISTIAPKVEGQVFVGWEPSIANITADTTLRPVYGGDEDADFSEDNLSGTIPEDWEYGD